MPAIQGRLDTGGMCVVTATLRPPDRVIGARRHRVGFAVLDTGAELSVVSRRLIAPLLPLPEQASKKFTWRGISAPRPVVVVSMAIQAGAAASARELGRIRLAIVDDFGEDSIDVLLGADAMEGGVLTVDYERHRWEFRLPPPR